MMAKEKKKVPNLRFKGFTDDWEQRKLGEVAEFYNGDRGPNYPKPSEIVEQGVPFINAGDLINGHIDYHNCKHITSDKFNQLNGAKLKINDIVYCLRGTIGKNGLVNSDANATIASSLVCIRPVKLRPLFLFQLLNSSIEERQRKMVDEGAAQPNISATNLKKFLIPVPNDNEQEKIGEVFSKLNHLITLQQRKLDLLKQFKKGLLQKMFADKDSKQPILRFKGFHDDWEQRKLSKVKDVRDGTHDSPKYHEKGFPLITSKNLTPSGVDFSDASLIDEHDYQEINKRSLVEIHDILFGMIGTIGNPVIVKKSGFAIKNVALIKHGGNLSNYFLLNLLNSPIFAKYINKENAGGTQKFLSLSIIRNFRFLAPGSDEQNKIGNMFEQVDTFITLQQQKLAKYQSIKKSLLQQMFI